jgi:hypothetical protein
LSCHSIGPALEWSSVKPCCTRRATKSGRPEEVMNWRIPLAALFVVLALTGCTPSAGGSGQARTAPYPQQEPRDASGMH